MLLQKCTSSLWIKEGPEVISQALDPRSLYLALADFPRSKCDTISVVLPCWLKHLEDTSIVHNWSVQTRQRDKLHSRNQTEP